MKKRCFTLLLASLALAQDAPKTMNRITVQLDGSEVPQNSFARKPKTIYRAGSTYCRIEEAPDPEHNIHGLLIVNEPNAWMVNLATKTAQHTVDPGPTFHCHLPIFTGPVPNTPDEVDYTKLGLEFGYELEYFKKMGAVRQDPGPVLQKQQMVAYFLDMGGTRFALFTYGPNEFPLLVSHTVGNKGEMFWYSGYGRVPFAPTSLRSPKASLLPKPRVRLRTSFATRCVLYMRCLLFRRSCIVATEFSEDSDD